VKYKTKGFTLVELMLVIIIIGTLVAMIVPRFAGRSKEAKITAAMADINANISTALDLFELDNGFYPSSEQGLNALKEKPSSSPLPKKWKGPYLKKGSPKDPWGTVYVYRQPGTHNPGSFDLFSFGPDGLEGGGDDVTNWEEDSK